MGEGRQEPTVDVVVIGLNSQKTLGDCLASIRASLYPAELIKIYYADGGSNDGSQDLARSLGAVVVDVVSVTPTPGRQRNEGWRAGNGVCVQFLDSDTVMDPGWLPTAVAALAPGVAAVCGNRTERFPEASLYNWIGDQEWNGPSGPAEAFGGDVLVLRSTLELTGGYHPDLIAGEDPELSFRIRKAGLQILKLDAPMTKHDLAMHRFRQYWKRAYRTGHAYAEVHSMHRDRWAAECRRIVLRSSLLLLAVLSAVAGVFLPWAFVVTLVGLLGFLRPRLLLVDRLSKQMALTKKNARIYSWHVSFVVLPQAFGLIRYKVGCWLGHPLTNRVVLKGVLS